MNDNIPVGYNNEGEWIGQKDDRVFEIDFPKAVRGLTDQSVKEEIEMEIEKALQAEDIVFNPKNLI